MEPELELCSWTLTFRFISNFCFFFPQVVSPLCCATLTMFNASFPFSLRVGKGGRWRWKGRAVGSGGAEGGQAMSLHFVAPLLSSLQGESEQTPGY